MAASQIGAKEGPVGSNSGPAVRMYQAAADDRGGTGWAWCAAFVCWCVACGIKLPRTASAFAFGDRGRRVGAKILRPGRPGFSTSVATSSSTRPATSASPACRTGGTLHVIEGNASDDGSREGYEVTRQVRSRI